NSRNATFSNFVYPSNQVTMVLSNTPTSVIVTVTGVIPPPPAPILHIAQLSTNAGLLYWSTNFPAYHLEYNPSLGTTNWAASGRTPVIVGTNFNVTNSLTGPQKFYRLSSVPAPFVPPGPSLSIQLISPGFVELLWPIDDDRPFMLQSAGALNSTT